MLNTRQTEKLSGKGFRVPEMMEVRKQLPFERVRVSKRPRFSPFEVFLLAIHTEVCKLWKLSVGEVSTIVSEIRPGLISQWPAFQKQETNFEKQEIWLVREKKPNSEFNLWLANEKGIVELLQKKLEEDWPDRPVIGWSQEALKVERALSARGVSVEEIQRAMLSVDQKRFADAYRDLPQRLWVLNVSETMRSLCEEAKRQRIELPALDDLPAWLGEGVAN